MLTRLEIKSDAIIAVVASAATTIDCVSLGHISPVMKSR